MVESLRHSLRPFVLALALVLLLGCSQGGNIGDPAGSPGPGSGVGMDGGLSPEGTPSPDRITVETTIVTVYYTVQGTTTSRIFDSIARLGPLNEGERATGLTETVWAYRLETLPGSFGCSIGPMKISLDITVTLPALENLASLSEELTVKWQDFADGVAVHEQRHVEINLTGADTIRTKILELPSVADCSSLEAQVETVWNTQQRSIQAEHDAFHTAEEARVADLRAPILAQIEANRDRIQLLAAEIDRLDAEIEVESAEVTQVEVQLEVLRYQIDSILGSYPDSNLPEDVFPLYDELRVHFNSLAGTFNSLVDIYNQTIAERSRVADERDVLVTATNQLVEDFNWTR